MMPGQYLKDFCGKRAGGINLSGDLHNPRAFFPPIFQLNKDQRPDGVFCTF
jgi:hypothetical protein